MVDFQAKVPGVFVRLLAAKEPTQNVMILCGLPEVRYTINIPYLEAHGT